MSKKKVLGIDIGGTKVAAGIVDSVGNYSYQTELPSNTTTAETMFQTVVDVINKVLNDSKLSINEFYGIGIGIPGKVDLKNGIAVFQNNIPWNNFPIINRLKSKYGESIKIVIDNDVKMAAYAEYKMKKISKEKIFTYVTVSTGIAATSIIDDKILRGNGFSGEIGYIPYKTQEKYIALEKYASGPAIHEAVKEAGSTKEVFSLAFNGNEEAMRVLQETAHALSIGLYSIICVLDPSSIVLGGSVAYHNPKFVEMIVDEVSTLIHDEQKHILQSIEISSLGSMNGLVGAGMKALA